MSWWTHYSPLIKVGATPVLSDETAESLTKTVPLSTAIYKESYGENRDIGRETQSSGLPKLQYGSFMGMRALESAIVASSRLFLNNSKLRVKDIAGWSTAEIKQVPGEITFFVKDPGVFVAVAEQFDKRKTK
jgi:hypothetical protein